MPFRLINSSSEIIRLLLMMYVFFLLSLRNVEDLLFERGIDIWHETVRLWCNRFCPMFTIGIRRQLVNAMRGLPNSKNCWQEENVRMTVKQQGWLFAKT